MTPASLKKRTRMSTSTAQAFEPGLLGLIKLQPRLARERTFAERRCLGKIARRGWGTRKARNCSAGNSSRRQRHLLLRITTISYARAFAELLECIRSSGEAHRQRGGLRAQQCEVLIFISPGILSHRFTSRALQIDYKSEITYPGNRQLVQKALCFLDELSKCRRLRTSS